MAFSRQILSPYQELDEKTIIANFVGIGMIFSAHGAHDPNIEDTLFMASLEGLENNDLRVLSILTTWIDVHYAAVNLDRMVKIVSSHSSARVRAYWASIAKQYIKDRRFVKMVNVYNGPTIDLLPIGTDFQISRRGEDKRFTGTSIRVPEGTLRDRKSDVLTPAQLAQSHAHYRWRTIIGPSYRADMWAELEKNAELSVAELARHAYGSFATAWRVQKDWSIVHNHSRKLANI